MVEWVESEKDGLDYVKMLMSLLLPLNQVSWSFSCCNRGSCFLKSQFSSSRDSNREWNSKPCRAERGLKAIYLTKPEFLALFHGDWEICIYN